VLARSGSPWGQDLHVWTRRDDGLVEDHSGGYRIEPLRPDGCLIGLRHGEVRPVLIQSPLGSDHDHLWQIRTP